MGLTVLPIRLQAPVSMRLAALGDLHGADPAPILEQLRALQPDGILLTGDILQGPWLKRPWAQDWKEQYDRGIRLMEGCAAMAITCYVGGNHENGLSADRLEEVRATGAIPLMETAITLGGIHLGGIFSPASFGKGQKEPDTAFLQRFAQQDGYKVLLCHHPEFFDPYIQELDIDLTVCGHAHGGQWRIGRQGVFAPGQGIFPRYTCGLYHGRLAVHTGLGDHTRVPRICNPHTMLDITLTK